MLDRVILSDGLRSIEELTPRSDSDQAVDARRRAPAERGGPRAGPGGAPGGANLGGSSSEIENARLGDSATGGTVCLCFTKMGSYFKLKSLLLRVVKVMAGRPF